MSQVSFLPMTLHKAPVRALHRSNMLCTLWRETTEGLHNHSVKPWHCSLGDSHPRKEIEVEMLSWEFCPFSLTSVYHKDKFPNNVSFPTFSCNFGNCSVKLSSTGAVPSFHSVVGEHHTYLHFCFDVCVFNSTLITLLIVVGALCLELGHFCTTSCLPSTTHRSSSPVQC